MSVSYVSAKTLEESDFRKILAGHAARINSTHRDLFKLHRQGGKRCVRTVYLEDGTMLSDVGGSKLIQHPDNRLAVIFNENPDKVRTVTLRAAEDGSLERLKHPGLASTKDMIVVSARKEDSFGLAESWVPEAVIKHNALVSYGTALHGILKHTHDREWRSESISYEIADADPRQVRKHQDKISMLSCGYGVGLKANTVSDEDTIQKRLWRWYKRMNRNRIPVYKNRITDVIKDHFSKISPKVMQGFGPRQVTFREGLESDFSRAVEMKYKSGGRFCGAISKFYLRAGLMTSAAMGASFLLVSGMLASFRIKAIGNLMRAIPGALWQVFSRRIFALVPAMTIAAAAFALYFISNTIANANAKQQQIWLLKNAQNKSNTFYAEPKNKEVMALRYQEADPQQIAASRVITPEEYGYVPADVTIHKEEPEFYTLNRLYSTRSVREGSLMEAFTLNAHRIAYYNESRGIERIVLPDLKTSFVTYSHSKTNDEDISERLRAILDEGDVIKISESAETGELEKRVLSYAEFEKDLLRITSEFAGKTTLIHPEHDDYMRGQEEAEAKKVLNRLKTTLGLRQPVCHA